MVFEQMGGKTSITKKIVCALKPGERRMCNAIRGFGVRRTPSRGKTVFFARVKNARVQLGTFPEMSVREARSRAREVLARIRALPDAPVTPVGQRARLPPAPVLSTATSDLWAKLEQQDKFLQAIVRRVAPEVLEGPCTVTVGELWERAKDDFFANKNEKTQASYTHSFRAHVLAEWRDTPVTDITAKMIEQWHSEGTRDHAWKAFKGLLKVGVTNGIIPRAPQPKIKHQKTEKGESLFEEDAERLCEWLEKQTAKGTHGMLIMDWALLYILTTGERSDAACTLLPEEVRWRPGEGAVKKERKGGKNDAIPISDFALELLRPLNRGKGEFLFPHRYLEGRSISSRSLCRYFQSVCKKLKITLPSGKQPVVHSLRHTFATTLEAEGTAITNIQRLLGHSDAATTCRYLHGSTKKAREAANSLALTRKKRKRKQSRTSRLPLAVRSVKARIDGT